MKFKNKTFLITGAKQGMGYEIAKKLHSQGAKLILNDKESDEKFDAVCKEFTAEKFVCDLSQIQNIKQELTDRKSTRLNSSHVSESRMPSSA